MEATKAYPQDIDATVLRQTMKEVIACQEVENNNKKKLTLTTFHSKSISTEAAMAYSQDIDATALWKP